MTIDFRALANPFVRTLNPYQPGKPIEELERELGITSSIKLASNENPLGPSDHAITAVEKTLINAHIYPDGACYELKAALAHFLAIAPAQITVGNGSENILELIVKSYLQQNDTAIISEYAFQTIPLLLQSYGVNVNTVPALNWGHNIDGMIAAVDEKTRVIFLVNPNNPTGTYTNDRDFRRLMETIPPHILVVVDEAYHEYITVNDYPDTLAAMKEFSNLIVTRTFSKVYGLAALRIGYSISSPEIADILNRARLPFNVNSVAAKAATVALTDQAHVKNSIALNNAGMQQILTGLCELSLETIPSAGNFVTVNVGDCLSVYQQLLFEGVIVRPLHSYNMTQHIRVTVGLSSQNERFLKALKKILMRSHKRIEQTEMSTS